GAFRVAADGNLVHLQLSSRLPRRQNRQLRGSHRKRRSRTPLAPGRTSGLLHAVPGNLGRRRRARPRPDTVAEAPDAQGRNVTVLTTKAPRLSIYRLATTTAKR